MRKNRIPWKEAGNTIRISYDSSEEVLSKTLRDVIKEAKEYLGPNQIFEIRTPSPTKDYWGIAWYWRPSLPTDLIMPTHPKNGVYVEFGNYYIIGRLNTSEC